MTIDEAIKILAEAAYGHSLTTGPNFYDAIKLGIEALQKIKLLRDAGIIPGYIKLPSEDDLCFPEEVLDIIEPPLEL